MARKLTAPKIPEVAAPQTTPMKTTSAGFGWRPRKTTTKAANVDLFGVKTYNQLMQGKSILFVTKEKQ